METRKEESWKETLAGLKKTKTLEDQNRTERELKNEPVVEGGGVRE